MERGSGVRIRDARSNEAGAVGRLLKVSYQQYSSLMPAEAWEFYLHDIQDVRGRMGEAQLIVADLDGRVVGTVSLYLDPARYAEGGWPEGWAGIRLLGVLPACRGRGIGRALMDECVRRCRLHQIGTIGLHTTTMMDVARRMYEEMGFVRSPEHDFHPRPDVVVMGYRLDLVPPAGGQPRVEAERTGR